MTTPTQATLTETPDGFTFSNAHWTLTFDTAGHWTGLNASGVAGNLIAPASPTIAFDVMVDGEWIVETHEAVFEKHEAIQPDPDQDNGVALKYHVQGQAASYIIHTIFLLRASEPRLEIGGLVNWNGRPDEDRPCLEHFRLTLPGFATGNPADCVVDAPGPWTPNSWVRPAMRYVELRQSLPEQGWRLRSAPDVGLGLMAISNSEVNATFAFWLCGYTSTNYVPHVTAAGERLSFAFEDHTAKRMIMGRGVQSNTLCLSRTDTLTAAFATYRELTGSPNMPLDTLTPAWAREMILLEVMPEYFPDGFREITERLPFYRDVGFNTVYLMPHWTGEHHGYHPRDLYEVNPAYGTSDDLRELVKTAHGLQMRVLFDMVIHGFSPHSPVVTERPDIFCHNPDGSVAQHPTWKSMTTDWASPAYRDYMTQLALHDLGEYDIDGYRVDAAAFKGPNWDPNLPYDAFQSGTESPHLLKAMLAAMREVKPDVVLLSEVFGPVFYTVCNLAHDNQTEAPAQFLEALEAGIVTAEDYKAHWRNVFALLPAGANRVYFARNHDTSWFYRFGGYTPRFLALDAIHALCAIPEVFAGDPHHGPNPDDDTATWAHYGRLFHARQREPALMRGELLLDAVQSDNPHVFTALRRLEGREVLVLVSLSDKPEAVQCRFTAPYSNPLFAQPLTLEPFAWHTLSDTAKEEGSMLPDGE